MRQRFPMPIAVTKVSFQSAAAAAQLKPKSVNENRAEYLRCKNFSRRSGNFFLTDISENSWTFDRKGMHAWFILITLTRRGRLRREVPLSRAADVSNRQARCSWTRWRDKWNSWRRGGRGQWSAIHKRSARLRMTCDLVLNLFSFFFRFFFRSDLTKNNC